MAIPLYLAMTASEISKCHDFPPYTAWMACHFSPYGAGLSNLPTQLPKGALLILNDRTPICGHDPSLVRKILGDTISALGCSALLLDLQRENCSETKEIVKELLKLPCKVCVSDVYAVGMDCPVFLPPLPLTHTPDIYYAPWKGREIWLDVTTESAQLTVTGNGCHISSCTPCEDYPFSDDWLCCHYRMELEKDSAKFCLKRTRQDIANLLDRSSSYGVTTAVGLWQELI